MNVLSACTSVHFMHSVATEIGIGCQMSEVESERAMDCHMGTGNRSQVLYKSSQDDLSGPKAMCIFKVKRKAESSPSMFPCIFLWTT